MVLIAITGEKWNGTHFARPCQIFLEFMKRNIDKVYCSCKEQMEYIEYTFQS